MYTESRFAQFLRILVCSWVVGITFGTLQTSDICVLSLEGEHVCVKRNDIRVPLLDRSNEICSKEDEDCWCMKAVDYTNDIRRRHGKTKILQPGPKSQLQNAKRYALDLGRIGRLVHQDLTVASNEVKCSRMILGENIAYNYENGDFAFSCVQQWEASQGHLQNILKDNIDEVVVGFYKDANGRVYCVQTFSAINGETSSETPKGSECGRVGDSSGGSALEDDTSKSEQQTNPVVSNEAMNNTNNQKNERREKHEDQNVPKEENSSGYLEQTNSEVEQNISEQHQYETDSTASEETLKQETSFSEDAQVAENKNHVDPLSSGDGTESEFHIAAVEENENTDIREGIDAPNTSNDMSTIHLEGSISNDHILDATVQNEEDKHDGAEIAATEGFEHTLPENHSTLKPPDKDMEAKQNGARSKKKAFFDENKGEESIGHGACRCLEVGKRCWHSLGKLTAHTCTPSLPTKKQPSSCKLKCCSYCLAKPKSRRCTNKVVKRLCKKMSRIIDASMQ